MNISDKEWALAESKAEKIRDNISKYITESVVPSTERHVPVEVLIPLTENVNQIFKFEAPYEYMDADNTTLKNYFNEHICQIEEIDIADMSIDMDANDVQNKEEQIDEDGIEVNGKTIKIGEKLENVFAESGECSDCLFKVGDKVIPINGNLAGEECTIKSIMETGYHPRYRVDWHGCMSVPYYETALVNNTESYNESVQMKKDYDLTEDEVLIINEAIQKYEDEFPDIRDIIETTMTSKERNFVGDADFFICEMAKITPEKKSFDFDVWVMEGGHEGVNEPHIHVYYDGVDPSYKNGRTKKSKKIAYISLNRAIYTPHHVNKDNSKIINKHELDELIRFFNTTAKRRNINCWQECVDRWLISFDDPNNVFVKDKNGDIIMPDYSNLNINYKNGNVDDEIEKRRDEINENL